MRVYDMKTAGARLDRWWRKVSGRYVPYGSKGSKRSGVSNYRKLRAYESNLARRERALRNRAQRTPPAAAILGGGQPQLRRKPY